jgi:outer membrane beta-barrel protein
VRKIALLWSLLPSLALAQLEDLENPGTVSAVQERHNRLSHELSVGVGVLPLDAFYKGLLAQIGYTVHFSDSFAWQVGRGAYSQNVDTGLRTQLQRDFNVLPTAFEQVQWYVGSDVIWSPFYGKTSYLNRSVSYFEVFLIAGGSVFKLTSNFRPAADLGIGARLFKGEHVSFRLDVMDNFVITSKPFHVPSIQLSVALNFGANE